MESPLLFRSFSFFCVIWHQFPHLLCEIPVMLSRLCSCTRTNSLPLCSVIPVLESVLPEMKFQYFLVMLVHVQIWSKQVWLWSEEERINATGSGLRGRGCWQMEQDGAGWVIIVPDRYTCRNWEQPVNRHTSTVYQRHCFYHLLWLAQIWRSCWFVQSVWVIRCTLMLFWTTLLCVLCFLKYSSVLSAHESLVTEHLVSWPDSVQSSFFSTSMSISFPSLWFQVFCG